MSKRKATKRELANFCRHIANAFSVYSYLENENDNASDLAEMTTQLWHEVDQIINCCRKAYNVRLLAPYSDVDMPEVAKAWRQVARKLDHGMKVSR